MNYIGIDGKVHNDAYLMHFNPYHDKLGRFASRVGGAARTTSSYIAKTNQKSAARKVASRYERINKRQAKIDKFDRKINSQRNQRRLRKSQKLNAKLLKAERKARKANMRKAAGYQLSDSEAAKIMKVEKLKGKLAGKNYKTEKWAYKAQKYEYRQYKDARKINNLVNKYGNVAMSEVSSDYNTQLVKQYLEKNNRPINRAAIGKTPYR